jgi:hypothetical protein
MIRATLPSNANVVWRQRLQRGETPTREVLRSYENGADFDNPVIGEHERVWRGRLECFLGPFDEESPPKLSCPSTGIAHHVPVVGDAGGNEKPKSAIRRFEHEMTMTTIQQFDDGVLQRFRVKLADRNAEEAVQEIGERVIN